MSKTIILPEEVKVISRDAHTWYVGTHAQQKSVMHNMCTGAHIMCS